MTHDTDPNPSLPQNAEPKMSPKDAADEHDRMFERILLPIDFSDHSKSTVSYAKRIALNNKSTLYLLHVFQVPDYIVMPYPRHGENSAEVEAQLSAAEQVAAEDLDELKLQLNEQGINAESILRVGYPFEEIVQIANYYHVDLIVIGSHGRSGIARLLVGSTAERVVEHASCPVLVVKRSRRQKE
jgi:nucleotide-binding universal stress UspA family protein